MAIYIMQAGTYGPIKIGASKNVAKRVASQQIHHYEEIRLLATGAGCRRVEQLIHKHFAADHLRGEWFRPSAAIFRFVEAVARGEPPYRLIPVEPRPATCESLACVGCEFKEFAGIFSTREAFLRADRSRSAQPAP